MFASCDRQSPKNASDSFTPLKNGFGFGQFSKETSPMHRAIWADFEYRDTNGVKTVVWPYIDTVASIQISNNFAVLLGDTAKTYKDGQEGLAPRVIAFEAPGGPPADITDQILQKWSSENGVTLSDVLPGSFVGLIKTNGALQLDFVIIKRGLRGPDSIDTADGTAIISWSEIEMLVQDVKQNGHLQKEKWSGVENLQN